MKHKRLIFKINILFFLMSLHIVQNTYRVAQYLVFFVGYFVHHFCPFSVVLLRVTTSDYPFGIIELFWLNITFAAFLPSVACRMDHVLFTLLCLFAQSGVQHIFCCNFLLLVYPLFPVSLDCPFLIAPSVFSNAYFINCCKSINFLFGDMLQQLKVSSSLWF